MRLIRHNWMRIDPEGILDVSARVRTSEYVSLEIQLILLPCMGSHSAVDRRVLVMAPFATALQGNDENISVIDDEKARPSVRWVPSACSNTTEHSSKQAHSGGDRSTQGMNSILKAAMDGFESDSPRSRAWSPEPAHRSTRSHSACSHDEAASPSRQRGGTDIQDTGVGHGQQHGSTASGCAPAARLITAMRQASGIYEWDRDAKRAGNFLSPGRVRVMTNGSLGPGFNEELGVLKRMAKGMTDWSTESLTNLAYRYLQMHVFLALDSDGIPLVRVHTRLRLPVPVSPLGNFYTTWKLAYQMHLDARPIKFLNLSNSHVDVYTLGSLRLSSQRRDGPQSPPGGRCHVASPWGDGDVARARGGVAKNGTCMAEAVEEVDMEGSESKRAEGGAACCNSVLVVDQVRMASSAEASQVELYPWLACVPVAVSVYPAPPTALCGARPPLSG